MLEIGSFYQNINGKAKAIKPFNFHFKQIIDLFDVCFVEFSEKFKENRSDVCILMYNSAGFQFSLYLDSYFV